MTVPSMTGSITQIQASGSSGSQNVSVPGDADLCIVAVAFYEWQAMNFSSLTLGGDALTVKATQNNDSAYGYTTIWTRQAPQTGTKSLAWSWSNAPDEGVNIFVIFLKDVDLSGEAVRASGTGKGASSATSSSFASDENDLCLCVGYSYGGTDCNAAPSAAGQSEIADSTQFNSCQGAIGTKPGVNGNTTMKVGGDYCAIAAVSIKGSISDLEISPGNADLAFESIEPIVIYGGLEISSGNADLGLESIEPTVIYGGLEITPGNADLVLESIEPTVEISGGIPPLGQGDTPGFVFWMLANSYYQNVTVKGYGGQVAEPDGSNAGTWGAEFFT